MNKQTLLIIAMGLLALVGGFCTRGLLTPILAQPQQLSLPNFTLTDLSGQSRSINEWRDKIRIINFWATWCPPCLKEMPEFTVLQQQYANKNVQFIGIALDDIEPVKAFVAANKINYPTLLGGDQGQRLAHSLGNLVDTVPFTLVVDQKGHIIKTHMGDLHSEELKEIILPLLKQK